MFFSGTLELQCFLLCLVGFFSLYDIEIFGFKLIWCYFVITINLRFHKVKTSEFVMMNNVLIVVLIVLAGALGFVDALTLLPKAIKGKLVLCCYGNERK